MFTNKFIEEIEAEDLIKVLKYPESRLIVHVVVNRIRVPSGKFEDKKLFSVGNINLTA
jgi:sulfur carrier protein ThiS